MKRASLIVVSYNGIRDLPDCLDSLIESTSSCDEIVVVDNCSTDGGAEFVEHHYPGVSLIRASRNLGYAGGVNLGIRCSTGQLILPLNPDVVVSRGWVSEMVFALEDSSIGIVGCKLLYPDGRIQHAGGILRPPQFLPNHRGYRLPDNGSWTALVDVDYVTGAAWGFTRSLVEAIGLMDEAFWPGYFEESDYCFRARASGLRIAYVGTASAIHRESAVFVRASPRYMRAFHQNRLRFVFKWLDTERILAEFVPAERRWLQAEISEVERRIMLIVYKRTLMHMLTMVRIGSGMLFPERDFSRLTNAVLALYTAGCQDYAA